jgi:hypothetical protein
VKGFAAAHHRPSDYSHFVGRLDRDHPRRAPCEQRVDPAGELRLVAAIIAFGIRVEGEAFDLPDLSLPWGQDAVIEAVASVNPNTIVVLETGNPVSMPWRDKVRAIVQAWSWAERRTGDRRGA